MIKINGIVVNVDGTEHKYKLKVNVFEIDKINLFSIVNKIVPQIKFINDNINKTKDNVIITPSNSLGYMDGGVDNEIRKIFPDIEVKLKKLLEKRGGLNAVGNPLSIKFENGKEVISIPTMPVHNHPVSSMQIYMCYINLFMYLISNNYETVSMTLFGTGYGGLDKSEMLDYLINAYIVSHKILIKHEIINIGD